MAGIRRSNRGSRCLSVLIGLALATAACVGGDSTERRDGPTTEYLLNRGWDEINSGDLEAARATFEGILSEGTIEPPEEGHALFGLAVVASESGDNRKAIGIYERIAKEYASNSDLVFRSLLNAAGDYWRLGDYDSAEAALVRILETGGDDREPSGDQNLMGNPFANHRHIAAYSLAEFYYQRNRLVMASVFLSAARDVFPYQHFCGNAQRTEAFREVLLESKILEGLGRNSEALDVLIPHLFEVESNQDLDQELSVRAARLMKSQMSSDELRTVVEESLDSIRVKDDGVFPTYEIRLMDHDLHFFPFSLTKEQFENGPTAEELRAHLLNTDFFRELEASSLPSNEVKG